MFPKHLFRSQRLHLEIYVGQHCWNCDEALQLAELARTLPGIEVQVIDLDQPESVPPAHIFAVPTYVLNGKVISLGNPAREEFLTQLQRKRRWRGSKAKENA